MSDFRDLVQRFANKSDRIAAIAEFREALPPASDERELVLSPDAYDALAEGLRDPKASVRHTCILVLDHVSDVEAIMAVVPLLDDPVPRVRRMAVHALGCVACKPTATALPEDLMVRIMEMGRHDPNPKVRMEAGVALSCRSGDIGKRGGPTKRGLVKAQERLRAKAE